MEPIRESGELDWSGEHMLPNKATDTQQLLKHSDEIVIELKPHLEYRGATCFEIAQWTYDSLKKRGLNPIGVAGSKGHSFVIVGDCIVDLWEPEGKLKAKVWRIGHVPKDQEPESYEDPFNELDQ